MSKMTVIQLLNKIANGEYPTVKYRDVKYEYDDTYGDYIVDGEKGAFGLLRGWSLSIILNDEVEIIEEDKKIEKIEQRINTGLIGTDSVDMIEHANRINRQAGYLSEIVSKINEIIDKLNEMEKE